MHIPLYMIILPLCLDRSDLLALARRSDVQILCSGNLDVGDGKEDFDMAWVTLVGVATDEKRQRTCTICQGH